MMLLKKSNLILIALFLWSCNTTSSDKEIETSKKDALPQTKLELNVMKSFLTDSTEHFRGLEIRDGLGYIAGSNGSILTLDLTTHELKVLFEAAGHHLRDIDILENGDILSLAITEPAKILLKEKDSDTLTSLFEKPDSLAFLDGIDFWDDELGLAFGDPLNDYPLIYRTVSGGHEWVRVPNDYLKEEWNQYAGFAASGTSVKCLPEGVAIIGLGNETAKFLRTDDYGHHWEWINTPFHQEPEGTGIYSLAFKDGQNGVAVGGHWKNVTCDSSKVYTEDGGMTWKLSSGIQEYRSCVTHLSGDIYIATGTTGTDISYDNGKSWELLDSIGYNAIAFQPDGKGIAVGSYGSICVLELTEKH